MSAHSSAGLSAQILQQLLGVEGVIPPSSSPLPAGELTDQERLEIFERVLDQVQADSVSSQTQVDSVPPLAEVASFSSPTETDSVPPQAEVDSVLPQTGAESATAWGDSVTLPFIATQGNQLGQGVARPGQPERATPSIAPPETIRSAPVEYEPSAELPVEVEGFLQRVEDHAHKLPQEIVLAATGPELLPKPRPTTSVVVLPIDENTRAAAKGKSASWSIAWLVRWSEKMIDKFLGSVIYRPLTP